MYTSITLKVVWPLSEPWCAKTRGGASTYSQRIQRISRWTVFACYHGHSIRKRGHLESTVQVNDSKCFVTFTQEHFILTFAKDGAKGDSLCLFVMDNDPSLTSRATDSPWKILREAFMKSCPGQQISHRKYFSSR